MLLMLKLMTGLEWELLRWLEVGEGRELIYGLRTVQFGDGLFWPGGVLGGFNVLGLGKDRVKREDPETEANFLASSCFFLKLQEFFKLSPPRAEASGSGW